jgi:hypothetical protein
MQLVTLNETTAPLEEDLGFRPFDRLEEAREVIDRARTFHTLEPLREPSDNLADLLEDGDVLAVVLPETGDRDAQETLLRGLERNGLYGFTRHTTDAGDVELLPRKKFLALATDGRFDGDWRTFRDTFPDLFSGFGGAPTFYTLREAPSAAERRLGFEHPPNYDDIRADLALPNIPDTAHLVRTAEEIVTRLETANPLGVAIAGPPSLKKRLQMPLMQRRIYPFTLFGDADERFTLGPEDYFPAILDDPRWQGDDLGDVDEMSGNEFERFLADLLSDIGYQTEVVGQSGDMGVDVIAEGPDESLAIQAKRYKSSNVSRRAVSSAHTGAQHYDCERGMVVTNRDFTDDAVTLAESTDTKLVDRHRLARLLLRRGT